MRTQLLDTVLWDLVLDASGNIAVASDPYSVAQDVASAVRVFLGEQFYDTTAGVPYFQSILGKTPPLSLVKTQIAAAALTVPGCNNPVVYLSAIQGRSLSGQIVFTDSNGTAQVAGFGTQRGNALQDSGGNNMIDSGGNQMFGSFA